METIAQQIAELARSADDVSRHAIITALRDISYGIETPEDTMERIWSSGLTFAIVRVATNLKLFDHLAMSGKSLDVENLARLTKADPVLLSRLLRYLAAFGMLKESGKGEFEGTPITTTLMQKGSKAAILHNFDTCNPAIQALPEFLERSGYRNPTDSNNTAWQVGWNTTENCFEWMSSHPHAVEALNTHLATRRQNQPSWVQSYPVRERVDAKNFSSDRTLFVDIGGNIGHKAIEFRNAYPELPGRVIVQDLPFAVNNAIKAPGVEAMVHDFNHAQPIKGAKFYYLRYVLHDWPDEKCRIILKNVIDAMADDTIILVDEMVLPDWGVKWQVAHVDLLMLVSNAAMERTESQWGDLYESVGLGIEDRYVYGPSMYESITALV
ncbi:S-adenosyl-L-methionine-dependent methyltransferase, partial [Polyplosphaeria fusca]